jgi:hypothetical protein
VQLLSIDGAWGYYADVVLRALRGDLQIGSEALSEALPRVSNAAKGEVLLMLGDVDGGVRALRRVEAVFLPSLWVHTSSTEAYYPRSVIDDPRYQALLEELGIGRTWRSHVRDGAQALSQVTGIAVTTPPSATGEGVSSAL